MERWVWGFSAFGEALVLPWVLVLSTFCYPLPHFSQNFQIKPLYFTALLKKWRQWTWKAWARSKTDFPFLQLSSSLPQTEHWNRVGRIDNHVPKTKLILHVTWWLPSESGRIWDHAVQELIANFIVPQIYPDGLGKERQIDRFPSLGRFPSQSPPPWRFHWYNLFIYFLSFLLFLCLLSFFHLFLLFFLSVSLFKFYLLFLEISEYSEH